MRTSFIIGIVTLLVVGCGYTDFDDIEDSYTSEVWKTNSSLRGGISPTTEPIAYDLIAEGVVATSDSSGNFYKEIIIVDSLGYEGAAIRFTFNFYDVYSLYPCGAVVAFNLKGLVVWYEDGVLTAGYKVEGDTIPSALPTVSVAKSVLNVQRREAEVFYRPISIDSLTVSMVGTAVELQGCYFTSSLGSMSGEREIAQVGATSTIDISTSSYAAFADEPVIEGLFSLRGIVTLSSQTLSIKLNNYSDMETENAK